MPGKADWMDLLVCPECRTKVQATPDGNGLRCETCGRVYPIRDGFPVMLPEEASRDPQAGKS
jgi:hypothetical protein